MLFTFFVFDQKSPFWTNLVKNLKFSVLGETWYLDEFEYAELNGDVHFFRFRPEIPFLGKFGPKNKVVSLWKKLKIVEYAEFNDCVHFFRFRSEMPFLGKFGPKNQNC